MAELSGGCEVTYLRFRKLPLNAPQSAIEMIAMGMNASGAQTSGSAHMPKVTTTMAMNAGSVTQRGHGESSFTATTVAQGRKHDCG